MTYAELINVIDFAAQKHRDQRRKDGKGPGGTPYINHPIGVARLLTETGVDDLDTLKAAILHDVIEDTDTNEQELTESFGESVAGIVMEVTDDKSLPKAERKRLQIVNAPGKSLGAKLVKLADKLYNCSDLERCTPKGWTEERINAYYTHAQMVVGGLRGSNEKLESLLDELFARHI